MVLNTLLILGIFSVAGYAGYRYMKIISGSSDMDSFDNDYTDVNTLTRKVQEQFSMMLKQDIRERNMTRRDYEQSQRTKADNIPPRLLRALPANTWSVTMHNTI